MRKPRILPIALTIAGSDSGGGAGIQADLKTLAALGVHGTTAITCVTAQNPRRVTGVQPCRPEMVRQQLQAVFAELAPAAVKTGMLYSAGIIREVTRFFKHRSGTPLVVDPVMIATSGSRLLKSSAIKVMEKELLPLATLVTPNLDEAELLLGRKLRSPEDLRAAARDIYERYGCAALVKGGHLRGLREAVDFYYDGRTELLLAAPYVQNLSTHGTGCTYSAAITGYLARGQTLVQAVQDAKTYVTIAICQSELVGKYSVLKHL